MRAGDLLGGLRAEPFACALSLRLRAEPFACVLALAAGRRACVRAEAFARAQQARLGCCALLSRSACADACCRVLMVIAWLLSASGSADAASWVGTTSFGKQGNLIPE